MEETSRACVSLPFSVLTRTQSHDPNELQESLESVDSFCAPEKEKIESDDQPEDCHNSAIHKNRY